MVLFMEEKDEFTGPLNMGNPEEYSVLQLAEAIIRLTNSRSKLIFKPLPEDDPLRRQPDISLARKTLGWEPKTGIMEGLMPTIAYFKSLSGA
jgi:UDP-glucuronate decarboxylase